MERAADIFIERLNTDKSRMDAGQDKEYHFYFELSGIPAPEWVNIFAREWKAADPNHKTSVEVGFLVIHCPVNEVAATHFPVLQKVVATTNRVYAQFATKEAADLAQRQDAWKHERQVIDGVGASMHFEHPAHVHSS
jgi:hypothetical protein